MTVLEALAILEAATLECKKRNVDTPEVHDALTLLEPHVQPGWLVQQFRHHALKARGDQIFEREGQQQKRLAFFRGHQDLRRESPCKRMDALAREFHETHDLKLKKRSTAWPPSWSSSISRGCSWRGEAGWTSVWTSSTYQATAQGFSKLTTVRACPAPCEVSIEWRRLSSILCFKGLFCLVHADFLL